MIRIILNTYIRTTSGHFITCSDCTARGRIHSQQDYSSPNA